MPTTNDSRMEFVRAVLADAALAFIATVVIGLIIASLAAAGIITMPLAYILLSLAWMVAIGGTFLVPWRVTYRHRIIFSSFLAVMLVGMGWFETAHYTEPPSAKDIATEVSKLIASQTNQSNEGTSHPRPDISGPLISTIGKTYFRCPWLPPSDGRTSEQIAADLSERAQAARQAFGVSIVVSELEGGGRKVVMEAITDEAKTKMGGATRWTLEMRKSGPELLVTSIINLPEPLDRLPVDRSKPDQISMETAYIEEMLHIPGGKCQML